MANPIIVVAKNRSGSKWLSNIIASHSDVACIQSSGTGGILETNMFFYFPRVFGDLSVRQNYLGFAVCYAESDFYKLSGLERDLLFRKELQGKDYFELFRWHMDEVAKRRGKGFWVQKANIALMPALLEKFPDARFLVIERDVVANIRSTIALSLRKGHLAGQRPADEKRAAPQTAPKARTATRSRTSFGSLIRQICAWVFAYKQARQFQHRSNVKLIQYDALNTDGEEVVRAICEHIGLTFQPIMLKDRFAPNTSFLTGLARDQVLTSAQERWIRLATSLIKLVPRSILGALAAWSHRFETRERFLRRTYHRLEVDIGWEAFDNVEDQHWRTLPEVTSAPSRVDGVRDDRTGPV